MSFRFGVGHGGGGRNFSRGYTRLHLDERDICWGGDGLEGFPVRILGLVHGCFFGMRSLEAFDVEVFVDVVGVVGLDRFGVEFE